jgi:hypothetical protein
MDEYAGQSGLCPVFSLWYLLIQGGEEEKLRGKSTRKQKGLHKNAAPF